MRVFNHTVHICIDRTPVVQILAPCNFTYDDGDAVIVIARGHDALTTGFAIPLTSFAFPITLGFLFFFSIFVPK